MTDGYATIYPNLAPASPPYRPPPPYNPAYRFPVPSAPPPLSWSSSLSQSSVYLPLLKVALGVGVTGCCLFLAYRASQRSQQRQRLQQRSGGGQEAEQRRLQLLQLEQQWQRRRVAAEERKEREGREEEPRPRLRAAAGGSSAAVDWLDVFLPASPSSSGAISRAVRRSLRRTCIYVLSGLGITGCTIAYLTLVAPRSSSLSTVLNALSSHQTRLIAFLTTLLSALAVQLLSKRHVRAKHLAFLLFHVGSGVALAPLFFLPSALTLRAALTTCTILASTVALTLSSRTRSSLWLYSPFVIGSSLLIATGLYDLIALFTRTRPSPPDSGRLRGRSGLAIVASVLLFSGYLVLDLQKLIVVSGRIDRERRRRAIEDAGLAGPAGPPPPDDDDDDDDEDDEDDERPRRPFFARPPPFAPGWVGGEGGEEPRRRPPSSWGASGKSRGDGGVSAGPVNVEQPESGEAVAGRVAEESWVSSEQHPDHMALALDLYLDGVNVFVRVLEWYMRSMQEQQEREGEGDDNRASM